MAERFRYEHRVSYSECTLGNHVYYSRYLDLIEAARGELFRQVNQSFLTWQEKDTLFPVVECQLRYRSPARYDDRLTVELWLTQMEKIRLRFDYRVMLFTGKEVLSGSTLHVCTSVAGKPKPVPVELREALQPYLHLPEAPGGMTPE